MVRVRVMLLLFLVLFMAPQAGAGDDDFDIGKVAPSDLGGADVTELLRQAHLSYQAGEYEQSARFYIRALRAKPGDANALYNLACCYGLLTMPDQAVRFVEAAWNAGFRDIGHIGFDPDFATVRETGGFVALMEKLRADAARREREGGRRLPVTCRVLGDVRVVAPDDLQPGRRYPLVVGLHGYGGNGESFARLFAARNIAAPFIYCVPQAPYGMSSGNELAMSWGFGGPGLPLSAEIQSGRLAEEYVLEAVAAVKREYLVDERRVFVLGFSQGAGMAFRLGMRHPEVFAAAIPIGGWCNPGDYTAEELRRAWKDSRFLICHSRTDRMVTYDSCERAKAFLTEQKIAHQVLDYVGGHSVPADLLMRIIPFIEQPVLGADDPVSSPKTAERFLLRYRFPSADSVRYRTASGTRTRAPGVTLEQEFVGVSVWQECGLEDGASRVAITNLECRVSMNSPQTGQITWDSTSLPASDRELGPTETLLSVLPGTTVYLTISARGEVASVSGFGELYEQLLRKNRALEASRDLFDDELRAVSVQGDFPVLPEDAVAVGARWRRSQAVSLPKLGDVAIDVEYVFAGIVDRNGRRTAVIEGASDIEAKRLEDGGLTKGRMTVRLLLDLASGAVLSSERTAEAEFEIGGQAITTTSRAVMNLTE